MGDFNSDYNKRVRYEFYNATWGLVKIPEPKGWNNDRLKFKRNDTYHGILNEFSSDLQFYNESKEYLKNVYDVEGVNGDVTLTKKVLELDTSVNAKPNSLIWVVAYSGTLDFNTYIKEQYFIKIKFNSSSLTKKIKAKESENIEIERIVDFDNKAIDPIEINEVSINGRELLFVTKYKLNSANKTYTVGQTSGADMAAIAVPFEIYSDSGLITTSPYEARLTIVADNYSTGKIGNMVYLISPNDQTVRFDIDIKSRLLCASNGNVWIEIVKFNGGSSLNYVSKQELLHTTYIGFVAKTVEYTGIVDIPLLAGQSIAIAYRTQSNHDVAWSFVNDGIFNDAKNSLIITENSYANPTTSKFVFMYDLLEKIIEVVGGVGTPFESRYLGRTEKGYLADGIGAHLGVTSGRWIRGFVNDTENTDPNNQYRPITISLKNALKSVDASLNLGFGIKTLNNKEIVFVEDAKFFYQPTVVIKLPNKIKKAVRTVHSKTNYGSLSFGYKKPNDALSLYDEAQGLDEPNTKNNYTSPLKYSEEKYDKESEIRADADGMEFARRQPQSQKDTRYDNDNWWLNLKKSGNGFVQKLWADVFAQIPTGIYSPETATNLWFSPANMRKRHEWLFGAGYLKNKTDYIMYGSSLSNSNLRTQLIGGVEIGESDNVLVSSLDRPRYKSEKITFEYYVSDEIMRQLKENTVILDANENEVTVPNFYFKVLFLNEDEKWETGYIDSVEPKGAGKWELILSNDDVK